MTVTQMALLVSILALQFFGTIWLVDKRLSEKKKNKRHPATPMYPNGKLLPGMNPGLAEYLDRLAYSRRSFGLPQVEYDEDVTRPSMIIAMPGQPLDISLISDLSQIDMRDPKTLAMLDAVLRDENQGANNTGLN